MVSICGTVKTQGLFNALTFHITALKGVRLVDTHLAGGWATPLKNRKVSWDDYSQYMENCDLMGKTMGNGKTIGKWWFNEILMGFNGIQYSYVPNHQPATMNSIFFSIFLIARCSDVLACYLRYEGLWGMWVGGCSAGGWGQEHSISLRACKKAWKLKLSVHLSLWNKLTQHLTTHTLMNWWFSKRHNSTQSSKRTTVLSTESFGNQINQNSFFATLRLCWFRENLSVFNHQNNGVHRSG